MPRKYTIIIILDDMNVDTHYSVEHEKAMLEEGDLPVNELIELAKSDEDCDVSYMVEEFIDDTN